MQRGCSLQTLQEGNLSLASQPIQNLFENSTFVNRTLDSLFLVLLIIVWLYKGFIVSARTGPANYSICKESSSTITAFCIRLLASSTKSTRLGGLDPGFHLMLTSDMAICESAGCTSISSQSSLERLEIVWCCLFNMLSTDFVIQAVLSYTISSISTDIVRYSSKLVWNAYLEKSEHVTFKIWKCLGLII